MEFFWFLGIKWIEVSGVDIVEEEVEGMVGNLVEKVKLISGEKGLVFLLGEVYVIFIIKIVYKIDLN